MEGSSIGTVHGQPQMQHTGDEVILTLNDLYCEEARDILLEVNLPGMEGPAAKPCEVLRCDLEYFNVLDNAIEMASAELRIVRDDPKALADQEGCSDPYLEEQVARIEAASAMERADLHAQGGNFSLAQQALNAALQSLAASPQAGSDFVQSLVQDINTAKEGFVSKEIYMRAGSKKCKMMMKGHYKQRSNRGDGSYYGNSMKAQFIAEVSSQRAQASVATSLQNNSTSADAFGPVEGDVFGIHPKWSYNMLRMRQHPSKDANPYCDDALAIIPPELFASFEFEIDEAKSTDEFWKIHPHMQKRLVSLGLQLRDFDAVSEGWIVKEYAQAGEIPQPTLIRKYGQL